MSYNNPVTIDNAYLLQEQENEYVTSYSYSVSDSTVSPTRNVLPDISNGTVKLYDSNQRITIGQTMYNTEIFTSPLTVRSFLAPRYHVADLNFVDGHVLGFADITITPEKIIVEGVTKVRLTVQTVCDNGEVYTDTQTAIPSYTCNYVGFFIKTLGIIGQSDSYSSVGSYRHLYQTTNPLNLLSNQIIAVYKSTEQGNWYSAGIQLSDHDILIDTVSLGNTFKKQIVSQTLERRLITHE